MRSMARSQTKKNPFRQALKSVLNEIIEDNEGAIKRIVEDIIEDAIMSKAIKECKPGRKVSREKVFATLSRISK